MAPTSPEAVARKRERNRAWMRANPRHRERKADIHAEDENWFVLTCSRCFALFDVPRTHGRLREMCEDCR